MKRLTIFMTGVLLFTGTTNALADGSAITTLKDASAENIANIAIAVESIDGIVLHSGDRFSFNEIVGPRTTARGFRAAENGRGVTVTGGGVARVASTIYLALKDAGADVTYVDLYNYGNRYKGRYVFDPSDAILVDYASNIDFSFVSNEDELELDLVMENGNLCCTVITDDSDILVPLMKYSPNLPMKEDSETDDAYTVTARIDLSEADGNTINNISLAAASINDAVLEPGDVFSFNDLVGPRSEKYGYVSAPNGRGKNVTGGGVAQVASCIWLAAKRSDDIAVISKSTYGKRYNGSYVATADDAIMTDYASGIDFSFRNIGDHELRIELYIIDDDLVCEIIGE